MEDNQPQLAVVIGELRNANAASELIIDQLEDQRITNTSAAAAMFVKATPTFLESINDLMYRLLATVTDVYKELENGNSFIKNTAESNRLNDKENSVEKKDKPEQAFSLKDLKADASQGLSQGIVVIASLLTGFVSGFISEIVTLIKSTKLGKGIASILTNVVSKAQELTASSVGVLKKVVEPLISTFKNIQTFLSEGINKLKFVEKLKDIFGALATKFPKLTSFIKGIPKGIGKIFGVLGKIGKFVTKSVGKITKITAGLGRAFDFIKDLGGMAAKWFGIGAKIGKVFVKLGKVLGWPLTIALALYAGIKGFIDGFKVGGIIGGIKGYISGMFESLIGGLLDLLKDGVSWVLGALGFKNAEKWLDSFSFSDLFKQYVDFMFQPLIVMVDAVKKFFAGDGLDKFFNDNPIGKFAKGYYAIMWNVLVKTFEFFKMLPLKIWDGLKGMGSLIGKMAKGYFSIVKKVFSFFKSIPNRILKMFSSAVVKFSDFALGTADILNDFYKKILKAVLPRYDSTKEWFTPSNLAASAIPDTVYKFADIDPKTGADIMKAPKEQVSAVPSKAGEKLTSAGVTNSSVTLVNNYHSGGNVTNMSNSNVNNNVNGAAGPILTGSAMGFANA